MSTTIRRVLFGVAISALGLLAASAQETKKSDAKGGIEGKIVKVDVDKGMLTIASQSGSEQTFSVTDETIIVGPRGGIVKKRLYDSRFHAGLPIKVVASGTAASELHLGYDRKAGRAAGTASTPSRSTRRSGFRGAPGSSSAAGKDAAKSDDADADDAEFPGTVKSVNPEQHMLVITLLNGSDRSFLVANSAKLTIGRRVSKLGLSDPALKPGLSLTVITEPGGRKVKEVKVKTAIGRRLKQAG